MSEIRDESKVNNICITSFIKALFADDNFDHKAATVVGWGRKHDEGFSSRFLHEVTLEILTGKQCAMSKIGNLYRKIPDQLLCGYQRNTDSCQVRSDNVLCS